MFRIDYFTLKLLAKRDPCPFCRTKCGSENFTRLFVPPLGGGMEIYMIYRLFLETVKKDDKIAWAFTFYNHQDFLVYKRAGISDFPNENAVLLEQATVALNYFEKSICRRYYDEHFSTRIDEDFVTLYTAYDDIAIVSKEIKNGSAASVGFIDNNVWWDALIPFLGRRTMLFETGGEERFVNFAEELALKQFEK